MKRDCEYEKDHPVIGKGADEEAMNSSQEKTARTAIIKGSQQTPFSYT